MNQDRESLVPWGWNDDWELELHDYPETPPGVGRVTAVYRDQFLVRCPDREVRAEISGKFAFEAKVPSDYPCVGDWVVLHGSGAALGIIQSVLPRMNYLSRKSAGTAAKEQSLAANIDIVFIVTDFDRDFNLQRIERYLILARREKIEPIILINKADLAARPEDCLRKVKSIFPDGRVYPISAAKKEGLENVFMHLEGPLTGMFLGSSGVGKSTLLNALAGAELQETRPVQAKDGQGVHTTSHRQLFELPEGGLIIDTPGLREIQLWTDDKGVAGMFEDIDLLTAGCRYANCGHDSEPGCAVKEALDKGLVTAERFKGYLKLRREAEYLKSKRDPDLPSGVKSRRKTRLKPPAP